MDNIKINGIKLYGYHGAIKEEQTLGQYFIVDVTMYLNLTNAGANDDLSQTVHYGEAYQLVENIIKGPSVQLIEHLAHKIIERLFVEYSIITAIDVTITKPNPPINGSYDNVSITLRKER